MSSAVVRRLCSSSSEWDASIYWTLLSCRAFSLVSAARASSHRLGHGELLAGLLGGEPLLQGRDLGILIREILLMARRGLGELHLRGRLALGELGA